MKFYLFPLVLVPNHEEPQPQLNETLSNPTRNHRIEDIKEPSKQKDHFLLPTNQGKTSPKRKRESSNSEQETKGRSQVSKMFQILDVAENVLSIRILKKKK